LRSERFGRVSDENDFFAVSIVPEIEICFYAYTSCCKSIIEWYFPPVVVVRVALNRNDVAAEILGPR
jgi:hypothetical protein